MIHPAGSGRRRRERVERALFRQVVGLLGRHRLAYLARHQLTLDERELAGGAHLVADTPSRDVGRNWGGDVGKLQAELSQRLRVAHSTGLFM